MRLEDLESRLTSIHQDALSLLCPLLNIPLLPPIPIYTQPLFGSGAIGKWVRDTATGKINRGENLAIIISAEPKVANTDEINAAESTTVHETAHYVHSIVNPEEFEKHIAEQYKWERWRLQTREGQRSIALLELVADYLTLLWLDESNRLLDWSNEREDVVSVYQSINSRKRRIELANRIARASYRDLAHIPETIKYQREAEKIILETKDFTDDLLLSTESK